MNWTLVSLEQAAPQPWKNGGGTTRELLAWPASRDWQVRMSVADVAAAGPFSRFPGVERWFAVLEGPGVVLQVGGGSQHVMADGEPFRFDGGAEVHCTPSGPTRDFNLMAPPGRARMQRLRGRGGSRVAAGHLVAVYAHAQPAFLGAADSRTQVPAFHLAWQRLEGPMELELEADGALLMEVRL